MQKTLSKMERGEIRCISTTVISLEKCRFFGRHGVFPQEREAGNEFEISMNVSLAAESFSPERIRDEIGDTVSYADLYEICKRVMAEPCNLLETVARRIIAATFESSPTIREIEVTITKLTPPIAGITGSAGVTIRAEYPEP